MSEAAAPQTLDLSGLAHRLRAGLAARKAGEGTEARAEAPGLPPPAAPTAVAGPVAPPAPPEPEDEETVEAIAREGREMLRAALEHGGIQRDSVRHVLACHALMLDLLPAVVREVRQAQAEGREPMPPAEREAWKAEFMATAMASLGRLETVHQEGARQAALAVRDETARLVRAVDRAALRQAGLAVGWAFVVGVLVGAGGIWLALAR